MGWWCAKRWHGARTAWCGWRRPKRCCKRVPGSGWPPSRRSMRPSWRSARSESARPGTDLVAARRPRRCQDPATATSTILVRQALTFRHYLKQHTKRFVGKVQPSPKADGYGRSCQKKQLVVKKLLGQCGRQRKAISFEAVCSPKITRVTKESSV